MGSAAAAARVQPNDSSQLPSHPYHLHRTRMSKTVSTCTTETVHGMHEFEIFGYSLKKDLGVGKFVSSGTFAVGGYEWCIRYYPDGATNDLKGHISIYLELMSEGTEVMASWDLRLVDRTTGLSASWFTLRFGDMTPRLPASLCQQMATIFNSDDSRRFAPQTGEFIIRRSDLESSVYIQDDCLTIECVIAVLQEPQVSKTRVAGDIEVPPSELPEHYGKLLDEKEGADVTFSVEGESFTAHKIVLAARSPVFKAELYGPVRERRMQCITVDGMQPAVFRALLYFIYTDSLPAMDDLDGDDKNEMIRHLLVAADRYAMERLKLICERHLCMSLELETVATTLALADQHHCSRLEDACIEFITSLDRMDDILASQGYSHLKTTCPSVLVDALERRVGPKFRGAAHHQELV